jgi:hypothetical protein
MASKSAQTYPGEGAGGEGEKRGEMEGEKERMKERERYQGGSVHEVLLTGSSGVTDENQEAPERSCPKDVLSMLATPPAPNSELGTLHDDSNVEKTKTYLCVGPNELAMNKVGFQKEV